MIVMFDTDHLNTFFLDALPIFAVGVDKNFKAPNDEPRDVPNYVVPSLLGAGRAYPCRGRHRAGFDRRHDAAFFGRSLGHRAAALSDAGHEHPGDPVLHQRPRAAAAAGAALLCARPGGRRAPSNRGRRRCASSSWARGSFSLEVGGPRMAAEPLPTACPIRTGRRAIIKLLEDQKIDHI